MQLLTCLAVTKYIFATNAGEKAKEKLSLERELRPGSVWRRRRDLNPRAGFPTYSLSRGAPSPLGYFSMVKYEKRYQPLVAELAGGGEEEIRTLGPLRDH